MKIELDLKPSQYLHLRECLAGTIADCNEQLTDSMKGSCPNDQPSSNQTALWRFRDNLIEVQGQLDQ